MIEKSGMKAYQPPVAKRLGTVLELTMASNQVNSDAPNGNNNAFPNAS